MSCEADARWVWAGEPRRPCGEGASEGEREAGVRRGAASQGRPTHQPMEAPIRLASSRMLFVSSAENICSV